MKGGEKLESLPKGVRSCLYSGISKNINFLILQVESLIESGHGEWKGYDGLIYNEIKEAMEWYKQHCVVNCYSADFLEEAMSKLDNLLKQIKE